MSLVLIHAGEGALLASDTPLIKASEAAPIADAARLLDEAERLLAEARAEAATLRSEGRAQGHAEASAAVRQEVAARLADVARDLAAESRRRDEELAEAALAAVQAMLGKAAPEVIGPALVRQALASFADGLPVELEVSPGLASTLRDQHIANEQVKVIENPALGPLDCELRLPSGTIRAGLQVQLEALAERWGLPPEEVR